MSSRPTVSAIIVVYNGDRFLAPAIQSLLDQRYEQLEIIVVDDGSIDRSADVARQFAGVRLVQQENRGLSAGRNVGVRIAQGELLGFLDADDLWTPDKLETQVRFLLANPQAEMVYGRTRQFLDPCCQSAIKYSEYSDAPLAGSLLLWQTAYDRVGGFDENIRVGQFLDWHGRAVAQRLAMRFQDAVVHERRIHDSNTGIVLRHARPEYASVLRAHLARKRSA